MGVQGVEACRVNKDIDYGVNGVACEESLANGFHAQVTIDLAKLSNNELMVDSNIDH